MLYIYYIYIIYILYIYYIYNIYEPTIEELQIYREIKTNKKQMTHTHVCVCVCETIH